MDEITQKYRKKECPQLHAGQCRKQFLSIKMGVKLEMY
jgi:hypothetical protein